MIPSRTRSKNEYSKIYVYLKRSLFVYIFYLFSWVSSIFFLLLIFASNSWLKCDRREKIHIIRLFCSRLKGGKSANNGKLNGALFLDFLFLLDVCIISYGCLLLLLFFFVKENCLFTHAWKIQRELAFPWFAIL